MKLDNSKVVKFIILSLKMFEM